METSSTQQATLRGVKGDILLTSKFCCNLNKPDNSILIMFLSSMFPFLLLPKNSRIFSSFAHISFSFSLSLVAHIWIGNSWICKRCKIHLFSLFSRRHFSNVNRLPRLFPTVNYVVAIWPLRSFSYIFFRSIVELWCATETRKTEPRDSLKRRRNIKSQITGRRRVRVGLIVMECWWIEWMDEKSHTKKC